MFLLFLLTQRSRYWSRCQVETLLRLCPALLMPISWYLYDTLETEQRQIKPPSDKMPMDVPGYLYNLKGLQVTTQSYAEC